QFAVGQDGIVAVDPETGDHERIATTLEGWATEILNDCDYRTGSPLARDWQKKNGPLAPGDRLLPKSPFVTGGASTVENLYSIADVEGMRFRGSIARQL